MEEISEFLKKRAEQGLLRTLNPIAWRNKARIFFNGREYVDFASNDYLSLSNHPKLIGAAKKAAEEFGVGAGASRLMSGDFKLHHRLEEEIARFKNKEAALFFNSGYQANTGIISSLYGKGDCIFYDRLSHASIIDGVILSLAKGFRFQHNDIEHLESMLRKERGEFKEALIITESVFSMDGDKAPLKELADLKEKYNCKIFVDEAHATGVFGRNGSGLVEEGGLEEKIDFIMGTFSKALAGFGAYLATTREIADYLINTCRSFIYSTALPPLIAACNLASIDLIREEPFRREGLLQKSRYLREALPRKGFKVIGDSQIIPVITGDNFKTVELADKLKEKGYWVVPVRPPTVPAGSARLRLSLSYGHEKDILDKLIDDISKFKF